MMKNTLLYGVLIGILCMAGCRTVKPRVTGEIPPLPPVKQMVQRDVPFGLGSYPRDIRLEWLDVNADHFLIEEWTNIQAKARYVAVVKSNEWVSSFNPNYSQRFFKVIPVFSGRLATNNHKVRLGWDPPPETNDLQNYVVYWGGSPGGYTNSQLVPLTENTTLVTGLISERRYYFNLTCKSADGLESPFANEVSIIIPTNYIYFTNWTYRIPTRISLLP